MGICVPPEDASKLQSITRDFVQTTQKLNNKQTAHLFQIFFYCTNLPVCSCPTLLCAGAELQQSSWTGTHPPACSFTATSAGFMHYFVPSSAGSSCASWCWRNWKNSRVSLVAAATQGTEQKLGCGGPCLDNRGVCPHHNFIIFCIIWVLFLPRSMGSSAHTSPARILCLHTGQQESPLAQNHECCWPELFEADFKVDLKSYFWLLVLIIIPQTWG